MKTFDMETGNTNSKNLYDIFQQYNMLLVKLGALCNCWFTPNWQPFRLIASMKYLCHKVMVEVIANSCNFVKSYVDISLVYLQSQTKYLGKNR